MSIMPHEHPTKATPEDVPASGVILLIRPVVEREAYTMRIMFVMTKLPSANC